MKNQPHVNERMRCILIDWLIQVHHKFTLLQETLYLTVSIIDRYLQVYPYLPYVVYVLITSLLFRPLFAHVGN